MPIMRLQRCTADPAGEAYSALPDPLLELGREAEGKGKRGKGWEGRQGR